MRKRNSPEEIDRWINTEDTEPIYEKYAVEQGITDLSEFTEKLKAAVPSEMAKYINRDRAERLFNDYLGVTAKELEEEEKMSEVEIEERVKKMTRFTKQHLYKEPRIFEQRIGATTYTRKYQLWSPQQIRWLNNRTAEKNNKALMNNFNKFFGTFRSKSSIQTKKFRLKRSK